MSDTRRTVRLRPGLTLKGEPEGIFIKDRERGSRHRVPPPLAEPLVALLQGAGGDGLVLRWLEARHLLESERVLAVEAWGREGPAAPPAAPEGAPAPLPLVRKDARFQCHLCGLCCESYTVGPVTALERETILAGKAALAPHVATPEEAWFKPMPEGQPGAEEGAHALGKLPGGRCVFLGADGLCEVHRHLGERSKPLVCRKFPLRASRFPGGEVRVTIKAECGSIGRSREDGIPLDGAAYEAWVREIAAAPNALVVGSVVHVGGDLFVPYRLARAVERRIVGHLETAPTIAQAFAGMRDIVLAVLGGLGAAPDVPTLAEMLALATEGGPAEIALALEGRVVDESAARGAARMLLGVVDEAAQALGASAGDARAKRARDLDAITRDGARFLAAALALRPDAAPPLGPAAIPEVQTLVRDALAVDPGDRDPAVRDLWRATLGELVASGRPLAYEGGALLGYATLALLYVTARAGARVLALRRGARIVGTRDLEQAIVAAERTLFQIDLLPGAPALIAILDLCGKDEVLA